VAALAAAAAAAAAPHGSTHHGGKHDDELRGMNGGRGGVAMTPAQRTALMAKLAGGAGREMLEQHKVISATQAAAPVAASFPPVKGDSSCCMLLRNAFDPAKETEPGWAFDIQSEVRDECSKFGVVKLCVIDKVEPEGRVYLRFETQVACASAATALHGRWFDMRRLVVQLLPEHEFELVTQDLLSRD
jgi:hypothetical protein